MMGKSKAKKDRRTRGRKTSASSPKRDRGQAINHAGAAPLLPEGTEMINAPLWRYPEMAEKMVESDHSADALTYPEVIRLLLTYPIYLTTFDDPPVAVLPMDVVEKRGFSPEEFIQSMVDFRRDGWLDWDASTRVHSLGVPGAVKD